MFFVWLILYGLVMLIAERYADWSLWVIPSALFFCIISLVVLTDKTIIFSLFRLRRTVQRNVYLRFIPYLGMVGYNLFFFGFQVHTVSYMIVLFLSAVLEELIFRGILLQRFSRYSPHRGILFSAVLFSLAHLLNLKNGVVPDVLIQQAIYALAVGCALGEMAVVSESILPCIIIHYLLNITASQAPLVDPITDPIFWMITAFYFVWGIRGICLFQMKGCSYETIH